MHQQLVFSNTLNVFDLLNELQTFVPIRDRSYVSTSDDGSYVVVYGTNVPFDSTTATKAILSPEFFSLEEAFVFFQSFVFVPGVVYVVRCRTGHKVQVRVRTENEYFKLACAREEIAQYERELSFKEHFEKQAAAASKPKCIVRYLR